MGTKKNAIKIYLTKQEVITLAGIIGALYGQTLEDVYNELMLHLKADDEKIALEISRLLDQKIEIDEDKYLYRATKHILGVINHD